MTETGGPARAADGRQVTPVQPPLRQPREPKLNPPSYVLDNHGGRVLDPGSALRIDDEQIRPTVYVGNELLVRRSLDDDAVLSLVADAAAEEKLAIQVDRSGEDVLETCREAGLFELASRVLAIKVTLVPADRTKPAPPPDAWNVLQRYRGAVGPRTPRARLVSLNHLVSAMAGTSVQSENGGVHGTPFAHGPAYIDGAPFAHGPAYVDGAPFAHGPAFRDGGDAASQYGVPGYGGRMPVGYAGPPPRRTPDADISCRRPVVAVLDTGVGHHPWLDDSIVTRHAHVGSLPLGENENTLDEMTGAVDEPLQGTLDSDAGHGTFIAGLIRQACPDADILSVRVMHSDGVVQEGELLTALNRLLLRHALGQATGHPEWIVDVVALSLGYYHELPSDYAYDSLILEPLLELAKRGVAVVAAAGNDSTARPLYPAGFSPYPDGPVAASRDALPIVGVGALNPDRTSVALFSNAGPWVTCHRVGANVFSTLPVTFDGSLQPTAEFRIAGGETRATIDPDDYAGGFAVWSGTSFSAPVLAGELAQALWSAGGLDDVSSASAVARGWNAIEFLTPLRRPV